MKIVIKENIRNKFWINFIFYQFISYHVINRYLTNKRKEIKEELNKRKYFNNTIKTITVFEQMYSIESVIG